MDDSVGLVSYITHGREDRGIEYKSSFDWKRDASTRGKVIRTMLAMANLPDGGVVVVGVEEQKEKGAFIPVGVSDEHLQAFTQDPVQAKANEYADPYVNVKVERVPYEASTYVVIQVAPFDTVPVICKREQDGAMIRGAIYTRPRRQVESVPVPSQAEMREILERAVEIRLAPEMARIRSLCPVAPGTTDDPDSAAFEDELGDL